ncbi:MAG TPA: hypothetical protein PKU84_14445, partial [Spirochaetota bacterium]|nr:hypothetical protein [Spirochaetota bacterium]
LSYKSVLFCHSSFMGSVHVYKSGNDLLVDVGYLYQDVGAYVEDEIRWKDKYLTTFEFIKLKDVTSSIKILLFDINLISNNRRIQQEFFDLAIDGYASEIKPIYSNIDLKNHELTGDFKNKFVVVYPKMNYGSSVELAFELHVLYNGKKHIIKDTVQLKKNVVSQYANKID